MSSSIAYIIHTNVGNTNLYWSVIESGLGPYGFWSFDIQDAKQHKTVGAAQEFASSPDGLNLDDDHFNTLPYIH